MKQFLRYIMLLVLVAGCIEPFEFQTETFEDALVIEASLTNEMKRHQVILSRAVRFEDSISAPERNAQVRMLDETQNVYEFLESEPGTYISEIEFAAQKSINYTLTVQTNDGTRYSSEPASFESESQLENVFANRSLNENNEDGIFVYADSFDSSDESQYYRYEYEETYKIIAPFWTPADFKLTNYDPCGLPEITFDLELVAREQEEQTCYNTVNSNTIIQTSTAGFSNSSVESFPVRFIPSSDFILTHRYSILVKQYVQTADAFSYYQSLDNFSSSGSVFTEIQPGFLDGNIKADTDSNKKVLGYFEVASVTEKRIFFGFRDFYPNAPLPLYIKNCVPFAPFLFHPSYCYTGPIAWPCDESVVERVARNSVTHWDLNAGGPYPTNLEELNLIGDTNCVGPYIIVVRECGDCTALGSNIKPDFWIE